MDHIGYIRVSTEEQVKTGVSLETQESKIRDYVRLNDLDSEKLIILRDEGESGKNLRRDAIQELIKKVEDKEVDTIVVYKLDRLCRNTLDMLNLIQKFEKYGVSFHSITEKIDTKTAMGKFFITVLSALAQMERDQISERTKGALSYKRSQGGRAGGIPYGYKSNGKKKSAMLTKDDKEQKVLGVILEAHRLGRSYNWIANELNRSGLLTRCNGKWYPQTIKSVILHSFPMSM